MRTKPLAGVAGGRLALTAGILVLVIGSRPVRGGAQMASESVTFVGSSSAVGMRLSLTVPGTPGSDVPFDGGGPTAQVAVDSLGTSTGYAAFPDPGGLVISAPGLLAGLLAGGVGGLPPAPLPSLPRYPFYVASDPESRSEEWGAGPYQMSATSDTKASSANATAGFASGLTGNTALLSATASFEAGAKSIVATATSDAQTLTFGPLAIGRVTTNATQTMASDGTITPTTSMEISGVRIGGVPVSIKPEGLVTPGPTVPLEINSTLAGILKSSGVSAELVAAQTFPNHIVAPALVVKAPFPDATGGMKGTMVATFGGATAELRGSVAPVDPDPDAIGHDSVPVTSRPGTVVDVTPVVVPEPLSVDADVIQDHEGNVSAWTPQPSSGLTAGVVPTQDPPVGTEGLPPTAAGSLRSTPTSSLTGMFDVRSLYLVVVGGALGVALLSLLIRSWGVKPWTSIGG